MQGKRKKRRDLPRSKMYLIKLCQHSTEDINMKDRRSFPPLRFWLSVAASGSLVAAASDAVVAAATAVAEDESAGDEDDFAPVAVAAAAESDYKDYSHRSPKPTKLIWVKNSFGEIQ